MAQITLEVSDEALANFKKVVEAESGIMVHNPLKLLTACLQSECGEDNLDNYAHVVCEGDWGLLDIDSSNFDSE